MGEISLVDAECTKRIVERAVTADELTAVSDFKLAGAAIEMYSKAIGQVHTSFNIPYTLDPGPRRPGTCEWSRLQKYYIRGPCMYVVHRTSKVLCPRQDRGM
mgnify:CR=1 FL=1|jgi:hypothetical protein